MEKIRDSKCLKLDNINITNHRLGDVFGSLRAVDFFRLFFVHAFPRSFVFSIM